MQSMQVAGLAPGTVRTRYKNVARVFHATVADRVIPADPCKRCFPWERVTGRRLAIQTGLLS